MFLLKPYEPLCTRKWSHIKPSFPHLGASPEGIVQCECCGNGVLEIKCPYNAREHSISDTVIIGIINFLERHSLKAVTSIFLPQLRLVYVQLYMLTWLSEQMIALLQGSYLPVTFISR